MAIVTGGGWLIASPPMTVTGARGARLDELDGSGAREVIGEYLGREEMDALARGAGACAILADARDGDRPEAARWIVGVDGDTVETSAPVAIGAVVHVLLPDAAHAARELQAGLAAAGVRPAVAIYVEAWPRGIWPEHERLAGLRLAQVRLEAGGALFGVRAGAATRVGRQVTAPGFALVLIGEEAA